MPKFQLAFWQTFFLSVLIFSTGFVVSRSLLAAFDRSVPLLSLSSFECLVAGGVGHAFLLGAGNAGACLQNEVTVTKAERICKFLRVATPHDDLHVTPKAAASKTRQGRDLIDGIAQPAGHILLLEGAL
jgi:hypothetical protein